MMNRVIDTVAYGVVDSVVMNETWVRRHHVLPKSQTRPEDDQGKDPRTFNFEFEQTANTFSDCFLSRTIGEHAISQIQVILTTNIS